MGEITSAAASASRHFVRFLASLPDGPPLRTMADSLRTFAARRPVFPSPASSTRSDSGVASARERAARGELRGLALVLWPWELLRRWR